MRERYVLLLVSLNPDSTDLSGIKFPECGYVESKTYQPDKDIRNGLYGTLWGKTDAQYWLNKDPKTQWRVVKAENNDEIIPLDKAYNFVKFRKGMVVAGNSRIECADYICSHCSQHETCDKLECSLVGLKMQAMEKDVHIVAKGMGSVAESTKPGSHAINVAGAGSAKASGWGSHAVTLGPVSDAVVSGEEAMAFSAGLDSRAIAMQEGGMALSGSFGGFIAAGKSGCAVGLGDCSLAMAGEFGFIALKYNDGERDRLRVAYVGEEIEAETLYRVTESGELEVVEESPVSD